MGALFRI